LFPFFLLFYSVELSPCAPVFGTCRNGAGAVNYCAVGQECSLLDRSVFAACAAGKRGGNNEYASFIKVPAAFNRKINRVIVRR